MFITLNSTNLNFSMEKFFLNIFNSFIIVISIKEYIEI